MAASVKTSGQASSFSGAAEVLSSLFCFLAQSVKTSLYLVKVGGMLVLQKF